MLQLLLSRYKSSPQASAATSRDRVMTPPAPATPTPPQTAALNPSPADPGPPGGSAEPEQVLAVIQKAVAGLTDLRPEAGGEAGMSQLLEFCERLRGSLVGLEDVMTRSAVGAARTSARLHTATTHLDEIHHQVALLVDSTRHVHDGSEQVARSAAEGAELTQRVEQLTARGMAVTSDAVGTIRQLRDHMQTMTERLGTLVEKVRSITQVSSVIEGIAARTNLLALNAAIEAARAGVHGRGFAVVAEEVRKLAEGTAGQTKAIGKLVREITGDLEPARHLITESVRQVQEGALKVEAAGTALADIDELARHSAGHIQDIAAAVREQTAVSEPVFAALRTTAERVQSVKDETGQIARQTFALSEMVEDGHRYLEPFNTGSLFHRALALARQLERNCQAVFDEALHEGKLTLDDVLALQYTEIKGSASRNLARLFDVRKVPPTGFTPPKFNTRYDAVVDEALQRHMDATLAKERRLIFALIIDLNAYGPIHNSIYCKDWTGIPEKDIAGNRMKRFYHDQGVLVRGARVGLAPAALKLPNIATREGFRRAGCDLHQPPGGSPDFLVQTYARDTGEVTSALSIPFYVQGHRFGAVLMGWVDQTGR